MSFEMACTFLNETDAACLINDPASEENVWIPLSQVEERHGHRDSSGRFVGEGTSVMSDWIAKQKGLA